MDRSFLSEGPVRLIARLVRVEPLINEELVVPKANRVSFEFDTIDATLRDDEASATILSAGDISRLALLKILTTADHFEHISDLAGEAEDGQWFAINLLPREKLSGPLAWASSLTPAGYVDTVPLVVEEIRYLFSDADRPFRPTGAGVSSVRELAQAISEACSFPQDAIGKTNAAKKLLSGIAAPNQIVVRDVGQASFCSAVDAGGNELFHLDAGWPISYNRSTASRKPALTVTDAPVILSHWDWDHLHGYYAIAGLKGCAWITPVQKLGPGAKRIAQALAGAGRLLGVSAGNIVAGPVTLGRCKGKVGNLNQTGLSARIKLSSGRTVLYAGDADYDLVRPQSTVPPDFIVATHHGAKFAGPVVTPPAGCGECVVSVGKGNKYGHPSETAITQHEDAGWLMGYTCEKNGLSRGSRRLGP